MGRTSQSQRWFATALLLFLILVPAVVPDNQDQLEERQYLYDQHAGVVIEYMPSADVKNPLRPDFLYSPNNGPRIVEFYAPWCPHCQDFRNHFVQFAKQMRRAAILVGVDDLEVHAISCEVHRTICKDWEIVGFPQLRLFRAGETNYTKAIYYKINPNQVMRNLGIKAEVGNKPQWKPSLDEKFAQKNADEKTAKKDAKNANLRKRAPPAYKRTQEDLYKDAHLSFHFALRNGIYMVNGPLSIKARHAFEDWLNLLHRVFPTTSNMNLLVSALLGDFENVVQGEERLLQVVSKFPAPTKRWTEACRHGRPGAGYTCGLWDLFHVITIAVTEWNQLSLVDTSMAIGVEDVAVTIRNYVENFFGCEVCRENFLAGFDSCAHNRCQRLNNNGTSVVEWKELPMWLFETHNSVNVRLLKEKAEREELPTPTAQDEINKQWPARDVCPDCWRGDGGWVENRVFEHLKIEYWYVTPVYVLCGRLCLCSLFRMLFVCLCFWKADAYLESSKRVFYRREFVNDTKK
jgi:thiol-disulfide isomerase/thioredoxin